MSSQQIKSMNLETIYNSNNEEKFSERCGEIFMINGRNMVFLCTLCEIKYTGFGEYVEHLDAHFPITNSDPIEEIQIKQERLCDLKRSPKDNVLDESEIPISQSINLTKPTEPDKLSADNKSVSTRITDVDQSDTEAKSNKICPLLKLRKYKCTVCTATCKDSSSFEKHMDRHSKQKTHQCPECQKKFYTAIDVKKHRRLHNREGRFLCTICGKICLSNFKLKDHTRRHTDQRDYKCPFCEKTFYNGRLLTQHVKVHSNERHHKCDVCEASFTYRKGLLNHMKLHENKRDYKCELCCASFNQQAGLFGHIKTKHKTFEINQKI